jgi:hypothetical protein
MRVVQFDPRSDDWVLWQRRDGEERKKTPVEVAGLRQGVPSFQRTLACVKACVRYPDGCGPVRRVNHARRR